MLIFFCLGFLLYALGMSLESEESFLAIKAQLQTPVMSFILWVLASAIYYHFIMGIKHLLMDLGIGETLEGAKTALMLVIPALAVGILFLAYFILL